MIASQLWDSFNKDDCRRLKIEFHAGSSEAHRAPAWMSLSCGPEIRLETERRFSPIADVVRCYKLLEIERGEIAKLAISYYVSRRITGARTRIGPRANGSIACRGARQQGMRSDSWPCMARLPNTFARDGICCPRRSTAKRYGSDLRVGRK